MRTEPFIFALLLSLQVLAQNSSSDKAAWLSVSLQSGAAWQNLECINKNWYGSSSQIPSSKVYWSNGISLNASLGNFQLIMLGNQGSFEINPNDSYLINLNVKNASLNLGYAIKVRQTQFIPIIGIGNSNMNQIVTEIPTNSPSVEEFVQEVKNNYSLKISSTVLNYGFRWQYIVGVENSEMVNSSRFAVGGFATYTHNISEVAYHSLDGVKLNQDADFTPTVKNFQIGLYISFYIL